jgi:hypothetical protein
MNEHAEGVREVSLCMYEGMVQPLLDLQGLRSNRAELRVPRPTHNHLTNYTRPVSLTKDRITTPTRHAFRCPTNLSIYRKVL